MEDSDFPVLAGTRLGFDLRDGLRDGMKLGDLRDLRRAMRTDRLIPPGLDGSGFSVVAPDPMAPEKSYPWYELTGRQQPPEAFGL